MKSGFFPQDFISTLLISLDPLGTVSCGRFGIWYNTLFNSSSVWWTLASISFNRSPNSRVCLMASEASCPAFFARPIASEALFLSARRWLTSVYSLRNVLSNKRSWSTSAWSFFNASISLYNSGCFRRSLIDIILFYQNLKGEFILNLKDYL